MQIVWLLFSFDGRIGRVAYLLGFGLPSILLVVVSDLAFELDDTGSGPPQISVPLVLVAFAMMAVCFLSQWATTAKRLHDLDKSGWLSLLLLVPLANIILVLALTFVAGQAEPNRFGPAPAHLLDVTESRQSTVRPVVPDGDPK